MYSYSGCFGVIRGLPDLRDEDPYMKEFEDSCPALEDFEREYVISIVECSSTHTMMEARSYGRGIDRGLVFGHVTSKPTAAI